MRKNNESVHDAAARHVQRRVKEERARQKLSPRIQDPATLDRIAFLIEGAAPAQKKTRAQRAA